MWYGEWLTQGPGTVVFPGREQRVGLELKAAGAEYPTRESAALGVNSLKSTWMNVFWGSAQCLPSAPRLTLGACVLSLAIGGVPVAQHSSPAPADSELLGPWFMAPSPRSWLLHASVPRVTNQTDSCVLLCGGVSVPSRRICVCPRALGGWAWSPGLGARPTGGSGLFSLFAFWRSRFQDDGGLSSLLPRWLLCSSVLSGDPTGAPGAWRPHTCLPRGTLLQLVVR